MEKNNKNNPKTQMSSTYSWRPKTSKSGIMGNRLLLGVRQLQADHPLTVKATRDKISPKRQR